MTLELLQWISPAVIIGVMLYLHRLNRHDIKGLRGEITDLRNHVDTDIGNLRSHVDTSLAELRSHVDTGLADLQNRMGRLEERMARLEGTLDVLRQFLVRNNRGTA